MRVLRYLKTTLETPFVLKLTDITSKDKCNVTIIADSDWAHGIVDRKSFSGCCVIIDGALINFITAKHGLLCQHRQLRRSTSLFLMLSERGYT
jgi:hypothetical protein